MAHIPETVRTQSIVPSLTGNLIAQGKVGDKYGYPGRPDLLVSVRSDRLSVFDFVLLLEVMHKGSSLTVLTHFFNRQVLAPLDFRSHLAGSIRHINYNMAKDLKELCPDVDLTRTLVVHKAEIMPYEMIFRAHLGGSVWDKYLETGVVTGVKLPEGMTKWQKLDHLLFTPSTKAEEGHDVNITQAEFYDKTGQNGQTAVGMLAQLYDAAYEFAADRGIALLDSKFEVGRIGERLVIADEWLTPDSSRYVAAENLAEAIANKCEPDFLDKQPVRDYCAKIETPFRNKKNEIIVGFKGLEPTIPEHLAFVSNYQFPKSIADETTDRYLYIVERLTGLTLEQYQKEFLL